MLLGLDQALRHLRELIKRQPLRLRAKLCRHLLADDLGRIARRSREHERARMLDRATDEETEIATVVDEASDELDPLCAVRSRERVEEGRGLLPI